MYVNVVCVCSDWSVCGGRGGNFLFARYLRFLFTHNTRSAAAAVTDPTLEKAVATEVAALVVLADMAVATVFRRLNTD